MEVDGCVSSFHHLQILFYRVRTGPGKPGKCGILSWHFPGLESPGKRPLVLESSGNLLNSAKKYEVWKVVRRINVEILGLLGLM